MKIKKPEDEKYFKDIVLNDILEEISNEVGEGIDNSPQVKKRKTSQKKPSTKKLLYLALGIILILFIIILFRLVTDATTEVKPITIQPTPKITAPQTNTQTWKMPEDRKNDKKTTSSKTLKEKKIPKKPVTNNIVKIKPKKRKILPLPKQKSERELAKEALRKQMLN